MRTCTGPHLVDAVFPSNVPETPTAAAGLVCAGTGAVALFVGLLAGLVDVLALFVGTLAALLGAASTGAELGVARPGSAAKPFGPDVPNCGGVIAKTAPSPPRVPTPINSPRFIYFSSF
jgi:hypothetical protein